MAVTVADLETKATWNGRDAEAGIARLNNAVGQSPGFFNRAASAAAGFIAANVAMKAVGAAWDFAKDSIIGFNNLMEQSTIGFTTMLGSGEKASAFLKDLQTFAAQTPFRFEGLVQSSQRLLAMGFQAKEIKPLLTSVGDAMAALGQGDAGIDRATYALGQMRSAGRVTAQDMMQLTSLGIPAWDILAKHAGVSVAEIRKQAESGLLDSTTAVNTLIAGMNDKFGGLMAAQAHTFGGAMSTIQDAAQIGIANAFRPLFDAASQGLQALAAWATSPAMEQFSKNAAAAIGGVISGIGNFLQSLTPSISGFGERFGMILSAVTYVFGQVLSVAQRVWPTVASVINTASGIMTDAFNAVGGWVRSNWPTIQSIVQSAGNVMVAAFQAVGAVIGAAVPVIRDMGAAVLPVLGAAMTAILPLVKGVLDIFTGLFQAVASGGPATQAVLIGIGAALAGLAAFKIATLVGNIIAYFTTIVAGSGPTIASLYGVATAWIAATGPVALIVAGAVALVAGLFIAWQTNFLGIQGIVASVWGVISGIFSAIVSTIGGVIGTITGFVSNFIAGVGQVVATIVGLPGAVAAGIASFVGAIVSMGAQAVSAITGAMAEFATKPGYYIGLALGAMIGLFARGIVEVVKFGAGIVSNVVTYLTQLPGKVAAFFGSVVTNITTFMSRGAAVAGSWASTLVSRVVGFVIGLPGRIAGFLGTLVSNVGSYMGRAATSAATGASNLAAGVIRWVSALPGRVVSALVNLPGMLITFFSGIPGKVWNMLLSVGKGIVNGLWTGIKNLGGWLWNQVTGFAQGIINNVLGAFGIHSPSTVFAAIGANLVRGLGQGISRNGKVALKAMQATVDGVASLGGSIPSVAMSVGASVAGGSLGATPGLAPVASTGAGVTVILQTDRFVGTQDEARYYADMIAREVRLRQ